jgi:alpha-beta hydrolase superfamily lysophospholipase
MSTTNALVTTPPQYPVVPSTTAVKQHQHAKESTKSKRSRTIVLATLGIVLLGLLYVVIVLYTRHRQSQVFFEPSNEMLHGPPAGFVSGVYKELVYWSTDPKVVKLDKPTILYYHGSRGNLCDILPVIVFVQYHGYNLVAIDYRGYGTSGIGLNSSDGKRKKFTPSEHSLREDAQTAYELTRKLTDSWCSNAAAGNAASDIVIWGTSLGGLAASHVASIPKNDKVCALILWSTFASVHSIINNYKGKDVSVIDRSVYNSARPFLSQMRIIDNLSSVTTPTVILHGKGDEVISLENAVMNFRRRSSLPGITKFIEIKGTHALPIVTDDVWKELVAFINSSIVSHRPMSE